MKARVFTTSQSRLESCDCLLIGNRLDEIHSVHNPFLVIETKPLLSELRGVRERLVSSIERNDEFDKEWREKFRGHPLLGYLAECDLFTETTITKLETLISLME